MWWRCNGAHRRPHDGLLSGTDRAKLEADGLEHVAVEPQIIESDPWGATIPIEW